MIRPAKVLLLAALSSLAITSCSELPSESDPVPAAPGIRAITFADWTTGGYASFSAEESMQSLAETGANAAMIIVTAYQQTARSNGVGPRFGSTPSDAAVLAARANAGLAGLDPQLKLHVDVLDGAWRGTILPTDIEKWFETYSVFVLAWAEFAETWGFTDFVIGTELAGICSQETHWRRLIAAVRNVYSGRLHYAASWDEADLVPFWDALDSVSIDCYFAVTSRLGPSRAEILAGWQPWLNRLQQLHVRTGKNVFLTEVGYRSCDGAGMAPNVFGTTLPLDLDEQADLYWAALQAISTCEFIDGICFWNWLATGGGGPQNDDYTPRGKPAEEVLKKFWKAS